MNAASANTQQVRVRLLDREFLVACAEDERAGLIAAGDLLDARMRELRGGVSNPGFERLAVLVALSVTHEFLTLQQQSQAQSEVVSRGIEQLRRKLDAALSSGGARE